MSLDTACASSLQALSIAMQSLRLGNIDLAVVGGASCLKQHSLVLFSAARSLTTGASRPFDAGADGLVAAEGYVAMVLKRLDDAVAAGDQIWGVVRDAASASDGRGKSLWAPRKEGQSLAIRRAYGRGIAIRDLQYIEAHATSTQVGDATEIVALAEAIGPHLGAGRRIPLGASKGNIGHTLETAGIAGLAKVLLAMKHRTIPPVAGIRQPNPKVDWERLPFYLPRSAEPWEEFGGRPRLAAINSFGIGGLNTHVVVEEHRAELTGRNFRGGRPEENGSGPGELGATSSRAFEPIAIIGMGAILPGALTVEALRELMVQKGDGRREPPEERWTPAARRAWRGLVGGEGQPCLGGFLEGYRYDWRKNKVPPKQVAQGNPLQFLLLDATAEALRSAGYETKRPDRERTGVVVGSIFCGDFCNQLQMGLRLPEFDSHLVPLLIDEGLDASQIDTVLAGYREYLLQKMPALLDETGSFTSSTLASRITKGFDLMGGAVAIDSGDASGLAAMAVAIDQLRRGDCELIVCAAAHQSLDFCAYQGIASKGIGLPTGRGSRPFSEENSTYFPGEGVAALVLKKLDLAIREGDTVRAVIRGIGVATDVEAPVDAIAGAMRDALRRAGLEPSDIDALETGGALDEDEANEVEAIGQVFGQATRKRPLVLRALAGQTGHCGATMGMAGVIAATLQLEERCLIPGTAVDALASHLRTRGELVRLAETPIPLPAEWAANNGAANNGAANNGAATSKGRIGVLAGGGTGAYYFVIVETGVKSATVQATDDARTGQIQRPHRAGGERDVSNDRGGVRGELVGVTKPEASESVGKSVGTELIRPRQQPPDRPSGERRIVWLFPGQGSQYEGMLKTLFDQSLAVAEAIKRSDETLRGMGMETFTAVAWGESEGLGNELWRTQIAMLVSDYAMACGLLSLGCRPDLVAGHSFGEFAALLATDAWSLEDAIRSTWERTEAVRRHADASTGLMAIFAPFEKVESLLRLAEDPVHIANHNSPEQVVVGGPRESLRKLAGLVRQYRIGSAMLRVPCAFHTPLMGAAAGPFADGLTKACLSTGLVPVVSTATNRLMIDPADYRDSMVAAMTAPVRYVDLIRRLDGERPTLFIEVGPQRILTKLNRQILGEDRIHSLPTDDPQRPGLEQLHHVAAACEAFLSKSSGGGESRWRPVISGRPTRMLSFDATEGRREGKRRQASVPALSPAVALSPAGALSPPSAACSRRFR
jgi:acyl transferase domain-containing protein